MEYKAKKSKEKMFVYDLTPEETGNFLGILTSTQSFFHCIIYANSGEEREHWRALWAASVMAQSQEMERLWRVRKGGEILSKMVPFPVPIININIIKNQLVVACVIED